MIGQVVQVTLGIAGAVVLLYAAGSLRPVRWLWRRNVSGPLSEWGESVIERGAKRVVEDQLLHPEHGALVKLAARVAVLEEIVKPKPGGRRASDPPKEEP